MRARYVNPSWRSYALRETTFTPSSARPGQRNLVPPDRRHAQRPSTGERLCSLIGELHVWARVAAGAVAELPAGLASAQRAA